MLKLSDVADGSNRQIISFYREAFHKSFRKKTMIVLDTWHFVLVISDIIHTLGSLPESGIRSYGDYCIAPNTGGCSPPDGAYLIFTKTRGSACNQNGHDICLRLGRCYPPQVQQESYLPSG